MGTEQDVGDETEREQLDTGEQQEEASEREDARCQLDASRCTEDRKTSYQRQPNCEEQQAEAPEQVLRSLRELVPEPDREHVEHALDPALPTVLRAPGRPWPMVHLELGDAAPTPQQHAGDEPMAFAVELEIVEAFGPVRLEGAARVVDTVVDEPSAQRTGHS